MNMRVAVPVLSLLLLVLSCERSPHKGFKEVADGIFLQLHMLGEGDTLAADGDSILLRFRAAEPGQEPGSFLSMEQWYAASDLRRGVMVHVLERMHEGDSATVIAPASDWPWDALTQVDLTPLPKAELQVELALIRMRTAAMILTDRERYRKEDPDGFEQRLITGFLRTADSDWMQWGTSLLHYRIFGSVTDTAQVRAGDLVTLSWSGRRLEDGVVIDDTERNGQKFSYRYGDTDQVIEGVATAVHLLRKGQWGEFLIPSSMAFGGRGINGILDPHSPMLYTVRLVEVERRPKERSSNIRR